MKYSIPLIWVRRNLLPVLFFAALSCGAFAQDVDSLSREAEKVLNSPLISHKLTRTDSILLKTYVSSASRLSGPDPDSSFLLIRKALKRSFETKSLKYISVSMELYGDYFLSREEYWKATTCYVAGLKIEEKRKDEIRIADMNDNLAIVYFYMEIFDKSLQYDDKALAIYQKHNDTLKIAKVLSHLGSLHSSREFCEKRNEQQKYSDFTLAIRYFEQAVQLCKLLGNDDGIAIGYQNIGAVYNKLKKPQVALGYIQKSLAIQKGRNNLQGIATTLYTMGKTYYRLKDYSQSIRCFKESENISKEINMTGGIQYLYEGMAQTYYDIKDYKSAYDNYLHYMIIRDSVFNAEKSKQVFELETKYQSEKKEKEIIQLTAQKTNRNRMIYSLLGLGVFLLGLGASINRNIHKNRVIAEQKLLVKEKQVAELEKERQLIATQSVLLGEEAERARLANDLHDGLGGMLSGVKINLSSMKGNSIITSENAEVFDHAIRLLDTSIGELRRVAHNLMPETLNHYGLKTALNDYITEMGTKKTPALSFRFFGEDVRYNTQLELTVYRISQELVNNALKHANAGTIDLQLIAETDRVCVQVVDNGRGFDTSGKTGDGKGLVSIRDRVTANDGRFDLESAPGQGTEATVEFLINKAS